jgi:hypothetical protein
MAMQLIWKVLCDQAEHLRARNAFLANYVDARIPSFPTFETALVANLSNALRDKAGTERAPDAERSSFNPFAQQ